jgi:hypothetical protein
MALLVPSPFLHEEEARIYSPLTDRALEPGDDLWEAFHRVRDGGPEVGREAIARLREGLWIVPAGEDLSHRFHLKVVSLEAHSVCNQACYFCPVSVDPRKPYFMPTALYERIVAELSAFRETIDGVCMINYNEPTADRRFVQQVATLKKAGLPPAVLTNGSGLTPDRVDAILELGGLRYLSVNLSTLDREDYARDRGIDQLDLVLRNVDYAADKPLAEEMDIVVLGQKNEAHRTAHAEITARFEGTRFRVKPYEIMDRAGYLPVGLRPGRPHVRLRGCENLGSRPLQHLHVTPQGTCVLCCEDYDEKYVVGDLTRQSVREVLEGEPLARLRRFAYGVEEAPADFICRKCVFARTDGD